MQTNLLLMILTYFKITLIVGIVACVWSFIFEKRIKKNLAFYDDFSIDEFPNYISFRVYLRLILCALIPIFNLVVLIWLIPLGILNFEKINLKRQ